MIPYFIIAFTFGWCLYWLWNNTKTDNKNYNPLEVSIRPKVRVKALLSYFTADAKLNFFKLIKRLHLNFSFIDSAISFLEFNIFFAFKF
jgi:hypothetical protein